MELTRRTFLQACAGGMIAAQAKGRSGANPTTSDRVSWVESIALLARGFNQPLIEPIRFNRTKAMLESNQ